MTSLRKTAVSGLKWTLVERFSLQGISFIASIVLARLLQPAEFGLIGMITIFITLGQTLMDAGLTSSLIRTHNPDKLDYSTVFVANLVFSSVIYCLIFLSAPFIARFYNQPLLTSIIRTLCLVIMIRAVTSIQYTHLVKSMAFRKLMMTQLPANLAGVAAGISMAYQGYGVWSLVFMQLISGIFGGVFLWISSRWRPSLLFSSERFRHHVKYGMHLAGSGILNTVFDNIYNVVIGRFYNATQLGYYTRSLTLQQLPVTNVAAAVDKVAFPLFASIQNDNEKLRSAYRQLMQQIIFWIAPALIGMAVLARPLFGLLFTDKWLPAVPYFQILAVAGILYPIHAYNLDILKVKGRSDLFFKIEVIKKIIIGAGVLVSISFGIYGLLFFQVLFSVIALFINSHYSGKFIGFPLLQQIKAIAGSLLLSILMGCICYFTNRLLQDQSYSIRLICGSAAGAAFYLGISLLTRQEAAYNFYRQFFKQKQLS
jgi:O-antigen/teichoic acid export membrane protein